MKTYPATHHEHVWCGTQSTAIIIEWIKMVLLEFNAFQKKNPRIYDHRVKGRDDDLETMRLKFCFLKKVKKSFTLLALKSIFFSITGGDGLLQ